METATEAKKRVWLKVWSANESFNADCDYAFVDLTPGKVAEILGVYEKFERLRLELGSDRLDEISLFDYTATYVSLDALNQRIVEEKQPEEYLVDREVVIEDGTWGEKIIVNEVPDSEGGHIQRTECDRLTVHVNGVYWVAYPKHCDFQVHTAEIPIVMLRTLFEEAK